MDRALQWRLVMADKSGLHRRAPEPSGPTTFYVRQRRGGFAVFMDGKAWPLSLHYTRDAALTLAHSLARATSSRVSVTELERTG